MRVHQWSREVEFTRPRLLQEAFELRRTLLGWGANSRSERLHYYMHMQCKYKNAIRYGRTAFWRSEIHAIGWAGRNLAEVTRSEGCS
jgi:hypothetical protein